jgi:hypothetical protein
MTRFAPGPDYHNQEPVMRSFEHLEFNYFQGPSKRSGNSRSHSRP